MSEVNEMCFFIRKDKDVILTSNDNRHCAYLRNVTGLDEIDSDEFQRIKSVCSVVAYTEKMYKRAVSSLLR